MKFSVFVFGLLSSIVFFASAAGQSGEFIHYLAERTFEDCQGFNIQFRENSPLSIQIAPSGMEYKKHIPPLEWPYSFQDVKNLIESITNKEPFAQYTLISGERTLTGVNPAYTIKMSDGTERHISSDGFHLFSCSEDKFLDVNSTTYIWNGEIVELPRYSFNITIIGVSVFGLLTVLSIVIKRHKSRKKDKGHE